MKPMKPSSFDTRYYGCPVCDWPLNPFTGEYEDSGGVTCGCGGFVPLPDPPQPGQRIVTNPIGRKARNIMKVVQCGQKIRNK
jgi:hypothetical protein